MNKLTNRFIVIIPVCNAGNLIRRAIQSVINQDFYDLGIIIRDDCSTDNTGTLITEMLSINGVTAQQATLKRRNIIFIRNSHKLYPAGNIYESVQNLVENKEAIIGVVDGDDELIVPDAVSEIYKVYEQQQKWLVWSQHQPKSLLSKKQTGYSSGLPANETIYSTRDYWAVSHFRTCKAWLFDKIHREDLNDPFTDIPFMKMASDAALLYPMIEMCGNERSYFLNKVLYLYNDLLPTNESSLYKNDLEKYINHIRNDKDKYLTLIRELHTPPAVLKQVQLV